MDYLQVTQFSGEELLKRFNNLENQLTELKEHSQPNAPAEYLTRHEVSAMLSISLVTLWKNTKTGRLKAYSINGRKLYKRCEVEDSLIPLNK